MNLNLDVTGGFYKPFKAKVHTGTTTLAELEEENITPLKRILYWTVFRSAFSLRIKLRMLPESLTYYITRENLLKNASRYFLKNDSGETVFTYTMSGIRGLLKVDITKPFKIAEIRDFQDQCLAILNTKFGAKAFELVDNYKNKICRIEAKRYSILRDYYQWRIELYSYRDNHSLITIFATAVQCLIKQRR